LTAIENRDFERDVRGVPVIRYEAVVEGEVPVGLGPLHTQFDGQGTAYTSLFIESAVAKWRLPPWSAEDRADLNRVVTDKITVHRNLRPFDVVASGTQAPYGGCRVAMHPLSMERHVPVGPSRPETSRRIDITGSTMTMLY